MIKYPKVSIWLTFAYAFITINVRAESWHSTILLSVVYPDEFQKIAIYLLIPAGASLLLSSSLGWVVNKKNRLHTVLTFVTIQKVCISAMMLLLWSMVGLRFYSKLSDEELENQNHEKRETVKMSPPTTSFVFVILLATTIRLANVGTQIAIEKDWPKQISVDQKELCGLNSNLKGVYLFGKMAVPLIISGLAAITSNEITALALATFSLFSAVPEIYILTFQVYRKVPQLARRDRVDQEQSSQQQNDENIPVSSIPYSQLIRNPVMFTSLSISLLYANILNPGSIVISYLIYKGLNKSLIAAITATSVITGLLSTFTFTKAVQTFGLPRFGLFSIWFQLTCVAISCISFTLSHISASLPLILFSIGIVLSRFSLWSFDLTQTQMLQEALPETIGKIYGLQVSLQSMFEIFGYILVLIWSKPSEFLIPSLISCGFVLLSAICFSIYVALFQSKQ